MSELLELLWLRPSECQIWVLLFEPLAETHRLPGGLIGQIDSFPTVESMSDPCPLATDATVMLTEAWLRMTIRFASLYGVPAARECCAESVAHGDNISTELNT